MNISNTKGLLPREMHHKLKYDSSDDEQFKRSLKKVGLQEQNLLLSDIHLQDDDLFKDLSKCPVPRKDVKRLFKRPDFAVVVLKDSV